MPSLGGPQIVVPELRIEGSTEVARFSIEETSEYRSMWQGYPRRRERKAVVALAATPKLPEGPEEAIAGVADSAGR